MGGPLCDRDLPVSLSSRNPDTLGLLETKEGGGGEREEGPILIHGYLLWRQPRGSFFFFFHDAPGSMQFGA